MTDEPTLLIYDADDTILDSSTIDDIDTLEPVPEGGAIVVFYECSDDSYYFDTLAEAIAFLEDT